MLKKLEAVLAFIIIFLLASTLLIKLVNVNTKIVLSDSMYPSIKTYDLAYIYESVNKDNLKVGDVVSFNLGNNEVMHRIVEINGQTITTKGDNNNQMDQPIHINDVNGLLVFNVPFGGYLLNMYVWIIGIGLYGMYWISKKIIKEFRKV